MKSSGTFFLPLFLLFITGCAATSMYLTGGELFLQVEECRWTTPAKRVQRETSLLPPLRIERKIIERESGTLLFERLLAESGYRFHNGVRRTVDMLFSPLKIETVATLGNLSLFELRSRSGKTFGLLVYNGNKKWLHLLYPLNGKSRTTLEQVMQHGTCPKNLRIESEMGRDEAAALLKWTPKMVIVGNLMGKTGGRPGRR